MSEQSALRAAELDMERAKTLDEKRMALARKIAILHGTWSNLWPACPNRQCRRGRACFAPGAICPMQPLSSEEELNAAWPEVNVRLQRALAKRRAEIDAAEKT